jgi:hypothetical protein
LLQYGLYSDAGKIFVSCYSIHQSHQESIPCSRHTLFKEIVFYPTNFQTSSKQSFVVLPQKMGVISYNMWLDGFLEVNCVLALPNLKLETHFLQRKVRTNLS